ncbi:hypothetical protein L3i22_045910 [Actinoplanes sp. L3-i22]|nr:hypothetical protein L3i22_045910 [Actinoplanes sp. L3-i22]
MALVEHGHAEVARRYAADGDGNCARALAGRDEPDAAPAVPRDGDHPHEPAHGPARNDREAELRALPGPHAAGRLASWLQGQGRIEEAVAVLEPWAGDANLAAELAIMLARHGRVDEAAAVLRGFLAAHEHVEWVLDLLCDLLSRHGRADEALAVLDECAGRYAGLTPELRYRRSAVLVDCGRIEQAVAELRDHPVEAAELLLEAGRPEQGLAVLQSGPHGNAGLLARLLIRLGRVEEALEPFRAEAAARADADGAFWRRFSADR